jgi:hypothetical protein
MALAAVVSSLFLTRSAGATESPDGETARWTPVFEREGVVTLRNERALPRAWLVSEVRALDATRILKHVRGEASNQFDPRRTALLEVAESALPRVGGAASPRDSARILSYTDGRVVIETRSEAPAFLVVSESYFPGWEATVDGAAAPIYQTNYVLQGVPVPAGSHRVEMRYRTAGAAAGSLISLGTVALLGGMAVYSVRRRRQTKRTEPIPTESENE